MCWKICTRPDECKELEKSNMTLKEALTQCVANLVFCQDQLQVADTPVIVPEVPPPSFTITLAAEAIEEGIREIRNNCLVYLDDTEYMLPPIDEVKLFILHMAVYKGLWVENEYDCDDFTLVLNAAFAQHEGWRWTPRFDCWYSEFFGPHSALLLGAIDENGMAKLYLIEGQEDDVSVAVKDAKTYLKDKRPWLVK